MHFFLGKIETWISTTVNFKASLLANSRLRRLQIINKNISFFVQNEVNETKARYLCEIPGDTSNIKTIKIKEPEFTNFAVKLSSLASNYLNNLDNDQCGKGLDNINEIYILQNLTCKKNGNSLLISGTIFDDELPSFSKKEIFLLIICNLLSLEFANKDDSKINCCGNSNFNFSKEVKSALNLIIC